MHREFLQEARVLYTRATDSCDDGHDIKDHG